MRFFVVRCRPPPKPSSCPSSCSVSPISPCQQHCCQERYPPNFSTQSPAICPLQCAIHCDDRCPAHCHLASSEQSSFLTIFNTNRKCPAKFFARRTVHTVGPSIVAWGDKSLHTYSKPRNKHHRLEGLLRFKKLIISCKLYIVS